MSYILEISELSKKYKHFHLNNISIKLGKGVIMGFVGSNGAGKTTVIKSILNLINPDGGSIKIFGEESHKNSTKLKDRLGFVFEDSCFFDHLNLKEQKNLVAPFYTNWDEEAFQNYAERFGLVLSKKYKTLSRGMKVKFALALALSHHAELLILDEPTSGLDPMFRHELMDILADYISDGKKSVFFSTHIISDLEQVADYITFIDQGEIVFSQPKDELIDEHLIVKGGKLDEDFRKVCLGIREHSYGFEALIRQENAAVANSEYTREKATIENIMLFLGKGEGNE